VLSCEQLNRVVLSVYPFMRAELFLRWTDEALESALETSLTALVDLGWLLRLQGEGSEAVYAAPALNSDEYEQLALLGQTLRPSLMRYFITVAILIQQGSGKVTAAELESLCHLQAQRLSLLREFNAPEFFDKAIFRTLIATLTKRGQARMDEAGKIHFDENLKEAAAQAPFVLPPDVRQTILSMAR
jgi:glycerol-3-phosphate O-acyltransferase